MGGRLLPVVLDDDDDILYARLPHGGLLRVSTQAAPSAPSGGTTDHAALTNLSWLVSDHESGVAAVRIAAFDATGATALYTTTGTGTVVALATSPTLATPTMSSYVAWTDTTANAGAAGRLQRSGAELSWHNGTAATNLEQVARKGAASGYAPLDSSSLVPVANLPDATTGAKGIVRLTGELGGTASSPTVTGIHETGGPTSLAIGAIATLELLRRSGSSVIGVTVEAAVLAGLLAAWTDPGYGDGADGSVTYAANTTLTEELRATDIDIDAGVTVTSNFPVRCTGTLTFDSSTAIIAANGGNASGTTGGTALGAGFANGWGGTAGANGRATTGNGTSSTGRAQSATVMLGTSTSGQGGDGGQSGGGNAGGSGGTCTEPNATSNGRGFGRSVVEYGVTGSGQVLFTGSGGASGGATLGGGTASSGAGGACGAICMVWSRQVDASAGGSITANGGNGSNATQTGAGQAGGGGGGGGGLVIHVYSTHNTLPTLTAAGGTKGSGINGGANGTDGNAGVTKRVLVP